MPSLSRLNICGLTLSGNVSTKIDLSIPQITKQLLVCNINIKTGSLHILDFGVITSMQILNGTDPYDITMISPRRLTSEHQRRLLEVGLKIFVQLLLYVFFLLEIAVRGGGGGGGVGGVLCPKNPSFCYLLFCGVSLSN